MSRRSGAAHPPAGRLSAAALSAALADLGACGRVYLANRSHALQVEKAAPVRVRREPMALGHGWVVEVVGRR